MASYTYIALSCGKKERPYIVKVNNKEQNEISDMFIRKKRKK